MSNESIMRKIRACLARAESSNENEAAVALAQAQKLMAKHGISEAEVSRIEITSATIAKSVRVPLWRQILASGVAEAFGVRGTVTSWRDERGKVAEAQLRFTGPTMRVELAQHAYAVLVRACDAAAAKFGRQLDDAAANASLARHPKKRQYLNRFREGYVANIKRRVRALVPTDAERKAIDDFLGQVAAAKKPKREPHVATYYGTKAGEEADDLSNPITAAARAQQLAA